MIAREFEAKGLADEGVRLTRAGRYADALVVFDSDICTMLDPLAMSYYAICLVRVEKSFDKALSLCAMAVEKEFFHPEIYLNLGRIFLMKGQKSKAVKAFKRGLQVDETHKEILTEIKKLGLRRRPFITWLPRRNSINIFIGKVTTISLKPGTVRALAR
ncbi:MAG: hypothetical protein HZB85_09845 [Deltaproteobacteria bacterium]|nr:hypothetical protein [Deltaproteobacteria bacterium]